jgi:hypothetical protein
MTAPTTDRPPSVWEDLLEIFYAPTAVFERRRETPAFGMALIIFLVLILGLSIAFRTTMQPIFDAEFDRGMAQAMKQNPQLTPEMMAKGREMGEKFMYVGVAGYALLAPVIIGLCLWLAGKLVESKAAVGQMIMVATYSMFPRVLEGIVNAVQALVLPEDALTGRYSVSLGLGRLLDPDSQLMLIAILGRIDVFTIWITVLMAIGLSVMGQIPRSRAAIAAAVVWCIGAIPGVWGAIRAG